MAAIGLARWSLARRPVRFAQSSLLPNCLSAMIKDGP